MNHIQKITRERQNEAAELQRRAELFPALVAALEAIFAVGYLEMKSPASQDYVPKTAIAKIRVILAKANANATTGA